MELFCPFGRTFSVPLQLRCAFWKEISHVSKKCQICQSLNIDLSYSYRHTLIKKLNELKDSQPDLAQMLLDQIYENAMIAAGLNEDPRPMVSRLNELLTKILEKN